MAAAAAARQVSLQPFDHILLRTDVMIQDLRNLVCEMIQQDSGFVAADFLFASEIHLTFKLNLLLIDSIMKL